MADSNTIHHNHPLPDTYGLVVCGGQSRRMGTDKSMLRYHDKPQRYHLYNMLLPFCEKVFISCNAQQLNTIEDGYAALTDHPVYTGIGPMAALLTAFSTYPTKNMLLVGCDYPFLTVADIQQFSIFCEGVDTAVAFYNAQDELYEPMLAWYPSRSFEEVKKMHETNQFSLQHFLKHNGAVRFYPVNKNSIVSVDTREAFIQVHNLIK